MSPPWYLAVSMPPKRMEPVDESRSSSHRLYAGVLMRPAFTSASGRLAYIVPFPVNRLASELA